MLVTLKGTVYLSHREGLYACHSKRDITLNTLCHTQRDFMLVTLKVHYAYHTKGT